MIKKKAESLIKVKKLILEHKLGFIVLGVLLLSFIFFFSLRIYKTGIFPFQSKSIECQMDGRQTYLSSYTELVPRLTFPRNFKIKFGWLDAEYIKGSSKFPFLDYDKFGYQVIGSSFIIRPTFNEYNEQYHIVFSNDFKYISFAYIDYITFWHDKDYDAFYDCEEIK